MILLLMLPMAAAFTKECNCEFNMSTSNNTFTFEMGSFFLSRSCNANWSASYNVTRDIDVTKDDCSVYGIGLNITNTSIMYMNKTELKDIINAQVEQSRADMQAWIENSYIPLTEEMDKCKLDLAEARTNKEALDMRFAGYEERITALQLEAQDARKQVHFYQMLASGVIIICFILIMINTGAWDRIKGGL